MKLSSYLLKLPFLVLGFFFLNACSSKAPPPVDPSTIRLNSTSGSRGDTPSHRLSKYEYPFDARGNYISSWAVEGERRAGRSAVKSTPRYTSSSRSRSSSSSSRSSAVYHTVRKGDTLSALSRRYGTSVTSIKSRNGLRSSLIKIGQRLRVK